jgi:acyl-coenzyme A thioesterase PaaI-like protein
MSSSPSAPDPNDESLIPEDSALRAFDVERVEIDGADFAFKVQITPRIVNGSGVIQGGLLATIMDIAAGSALLHGPQPYHQTTTMDMYVSYHAGARVGPALVTAHVLRRGGRSASVRVEMTDLGQEGLHCATGMLTFAARHLPEGDDRRVNMKWSLGGDINPAGS